MLEVYLGTDYCLDVMRSARTCLCCGAVVTTAYGIVTRNLCLYLTGRPSFVAGSKRHAFTALNIIDVRTLPDLVESSFTDSTSPVFEITSSRRGRSSRRTPGGGSLGNFGHTETGGTRPGASVS